MGIVLELQKKRQKCEAAHAHFEAHGYCGTGEASSSMEALWKSYRSLEGTLVETLYGTLIESLIDHFNEALQIPSWIPLRNPRSECLENPKP